MTIDKKNLLKNVSKISKETSGEGLRSSLNTFRLHIFV